MGVDRFCRRRVYRDSVCRVLRTEEVNGIVMSETLNLDRVRAAALKRIERSERNFKLAFFAAAVVEIAFVVSFLLLADLRNRMHLLLLISTVSCYSIVVLGLVALGEWVNRAIARVLKAVELSGDK